MRFSPRDLGDLIKFSECDGKSVAQFVNSVLHLTFVEKVQYLSVSTDGAWEDEQTTVGVYLFLVRNGCDIKTVGEELKCFLEAVESDCGTKFLTVNVLVKV